MCGPVSYPQGRLGLVVNKNKQRGDRAERAVRDWVARRWPGSFKTRAGFNDDLGDVVAVTHGGRVALQVKDVAKPQWSEWFSQLEEQVATLRIESRGSDRVVGGAIVHKYRGRSDPGSWRAVVTLNRLVDMLNAEYLAGRDDGRSEAASTPAEEKGVGRGDE